MSKPGGRMSKYHLAIEYIARYVDVDELNELMAEDTVSLVSEVWNTTAWMVATEVLHARARRKRDPKWDPIPVRTRTDKKEDRK